MKNFLVVACTIPYLFLACSRPDKGYNIQGVPFKNVVINDSFWAPRIEINRTVTIPYIFKKCEETRTPNFAIAAKKKDGKFVGFVFDDSDVYKIIEGASYSLTTHPDKALEHYIDSIISLIGAAQEPDGYIYTARTIGAKDKIDDMGTHRWEKENRSSHELYNAGHMYEAASAYFQATGKRSLLDIAIRNADLMCNTFGPGKIDTVVPGHQVIEMGLVKLYQCTGEKKYLDLAKFFLDRRGQFKPALAGIHPWDSPFNRQSDKPISQQTEAYGHAVRATYMYAGIADVAALTGNSDYIRIIDRLWENVVSSNIYITGGVGSQPFCEEYGKGYVLANDTAYNETCAAIANVFWNHRMFLLHGKSSYIDVMERTVFNGLISGYSYDGMKFFYPNPLECDGKRNFNHGSCTRQPWFWCSCCPGNVSRFLASLSGYIYAQKKDTLFVNLFIGNKGKISMPNGNIEISQVTDYPWKGDIKIMIDPEKNMNTVLAVRIPGWVRNEPIPSDLYKFMDVSEEKYKISVNSQETNCQVKNGYAIIQKEFKKGDQIDLSFPMPLRKVIANEKVKADSGRFCFTRGPLVYCAEGVDNNGQVLNMKLNPADTFNLTYRTDIANHFWGLTGKAYAGDKIIPFSAIPYYAWAHRGCTEMEVWFRKK